MKKSMAFFLAVLFILISFTGQAKTVLADDQGGTEEYRPIDVVLVIDTSGSMQTSDSEQMVLRAMQMFINMMPVADSRVAVVGFNQDARVYSEAGGQPGFVKMEELADLDALKGTVRAISYDGDTAVGNGLLAAADLFRNNPRDGAEKAIVLFSDGVDDLEAQFNAQVKYQKAQDNLTESVVWASQNNCPIYPIGFNYMLDDGKNSLGNTGIDKLNFVAQKSGGYTTEVNTLDDIETTFVDILANICKLKYTELQEVPGDGQYHEVPVNVPAGVVEMNIRINCGTEDALTNGDIGLIDPQGQSIELKTGSKVRFETEKTAVSIKVLSPEPGNYTLTLDKITGEDIKIGFLNHYQIGMTASLGVPAGNPPNLGYAGDTIEIQAVLTDHNGQPASENYYEDVTTAEAMVTSRQGNTGTQVIPLTYQNGMLRGSFQADGLAAADISVLVQTEAYTKSADLVLINGNHPMGLTGIQIPDQTVNVRKTVTVPDIYSVVTDEEGDPITAAVTEISDPDVLTAEIRDDTLEITGVKWGSAAVTVTYTDEQNNTEEMTFAVKVNDPLKIALLTMIPVIIALAVLAAVLIGLANAKRITGVFQVGPVTLSSGGMNWTIGRPTTLRAVVATRGRKTKLRHFMSKYAANTVNQPYVTDDQRNALNAVLGAGGLRSEINGILDQIILEGTAFGKKGFTLIIPKGLPVRFGNLEEGKEVKVRISGIRQIVLDIKPENSQNALRVTIQYNQSGR